MMMCEAINITDYMDEPQRNAYKQFSKDSWLSSKRNMEQFLMMNTFYRRNLHRFAKDYLGLKLHLYQQILLFLMGRYSSFVEVAARASAKSFIVAVYACCMAILYPKIQIVITSSTRGQSELIISKKIQGELCSRSPMLNREIESVIDNQNKAVVFFRNGSSVFTVTCNDNARGQRCNIAVVDEARACDKGVLDKVIFPFLVVRQADFMSAPEYRDNKSFCEEPKQVMLSSSVEETHWLYKAAVAVRNDMFAEKDAFFIAFDLSVTLKHGIRSFNQLRAAKRTSDPITWKIEYENAVLRSNAAAYFTYDLVAKNQILKKAFYPRKNEDVIAHVRNRYAIPKQEGEIRVVACDIAMVNRENNDNSVFTCMRLFPEFVERNGRKHKEWRVQIPYLEGQKGSETSKQAIRIRQLYEDFSCDYVVLDTRNAGRNAVSWGNPCYY